MIYRGYIKNGVPVFDTSLDLADGTPVQLEVEAADADFWNGKSASELADEQGIQPIKDLSELRFDWPAKESIDDFLAFIREGRE